MKQEHIAQVVDGSTGWGEFLDIGKPVRWERTVIEIDTREGPMPVSSFVSGDVPGLFIHRNVISILPSDGLKPKRIVSGKSWNVSHAPSGKKVLGAQTLARAKEAVFLLSDVDWTQQEADVVNADNAFYVGLVRNAVDRLW
jgi:hypothetical protein